MLRPLLLAFALLLAGCATVPETPPAPLAPQAQDGRGRIVVRPFYMPSGLNLIAGLLGGGTTPFRVELYDVTAEPRYLGAMTSPGVLARNYRGQSMQPERRQDAFAYDVPPGRRVLMLHMRKFGGGDFVDFVEVAVAANETEHVAISQYGMNDRPYLVKMDFDQRATRLCASTPGLRPAEAAEKLKAQGIPTDNYVAWYCAGLSAATHVQPVAPEGAWGGPFPRERVASLRDQWFPVWRAMADRVPPYDVSAPNQKGM